jgi:hypothetical protein
MQQCSFISSVHTSVQVNRQLLVLEEQKAKQVANRERMAKNRAEVRKEVDIHRRNLQHYVSAQA